MLSLYCKQNYTQLQNHKSHQCGIEVCTVIGLTWNPTHVPDSGQLPFTRLEPEDGHNLHSFRTGPGLTFFLQACSVSGLIITMSRPDFFFFFGPSQAWTLFVLDVCMGRNFQIRAWPSQYENHLPVQPSPAHMKILNRSGRTVRKSVK